MRWVFSLLFLCFLVAGCTDGVAPANFEGDASIPEQDGGVHD
jgi:hypothetical protein